MVARVAVAAAVSNSRLRGLILLADHFDQYPFAPQPVELAVEDLLPRAEIEFAVGDRDDDLPAHDLPLQVRVRVILARPVVVVLGRGRMRRELLQPDFVIVMETALVVVDENGRGGVRCLFVMTVLLPPCRRSQNAGNARKLFQMSRKPSVITLKHDALRFTYSKRT